MPESGEAPKSPSSFLFLEVVTDSNFVNSSSNLIHCHLMSSSMSFYHHLIEKYAPLLMPESGEAPKSPSSFPFPEVVTNSYLVDNSSNLIHCHLMYSSMAFDIIKWLNHLIGKYAPNTASARGPRSSDWACCCGNLSYYRDSLVELLSQLL